MIPINKNKEPTSLVEQRCTPNATYESPPWDKASLRKSLVEEQRALCAFCMQRIVNDPLKMKIAHVLSQHEHPEEQLNYDNLVGACKGREGEPFKDQHCDTRQGSRSLSINPALPSHGIERLISYQSNGRITTQTGTLQNELDDVLNLNHIFLINGRKATLDKFQKTIPAGPLSRSWLQKELARWSGEGRDELEPFCGIVTYYIRKKLSKL